MSLLRSVIFGLAIGGGAFALVMGGWHPGALTFQGFLSVWKNYPGEHRELPLALWSGAGWALVAAALHAALTGTRHRSS